MKLTLYRSKSANQCTLGTLMVNGVRFCYTMEDQIRETKVAGETAIPEGTYAVVITDSPRFKKPLPLLLNVPGFEGIRIHPGNTKDDTEGCILPGYAVNKNMTAVLKSRDAFKDLFELIRQAISSGQQVTIQIINI